MREFARSIGMVAGLAAFAGAAATGAWAQATPAQPPSTCQLVQDAHGNWTADPNCPRVAPSAAPAAPAGPAAQRFPFPGDPAPASAPSAGTATGNGNGDVPSAPQAPAGGTGPAGKRFPYPGETDSTAPAGAPSPLQDAGSSGSSSSSSSSSSSNSSSSGSSDSAAGHGDGSDDPDDPAADPAKIAARRKARRKLPPVERQSPSEREQEDVQVAGFYFNDGNFKGSYDRAKDAVTLDKDDPAAHLALAESARKLGKLDEAEQEYKQCLGLDPLPKQRKSAEKALKDMTGGGS